MTQTEIQQFVYDFFYVKGLPHNTICAIMGNITAESAWNVDAIEHGNEIGFGLCQWSFGRREQLEAFGTTLRHQCAFLWYELTGEQPLIADFQWIANPADSVDNGVGFECSIEMFLSGIPAIDTLTMAFCYCWERPAFATNHLWETRIPSAIEFSETMSYNGTGNTGGDDPPDTDSKKVKHKYNFVLFGKRRTTWKNRIF